MGMVWYDMVMVRYDMVWYGMIWYGMRIITCFRSIGRGEEFHGLSAEVVGLAVLRND